MSEAMYKLVGIERFLETLSCPECGKRIDPRNTRLEIANLKLEIAQLEREYAASEVEIKDLEERLAMCFEHIREIEREN